MLSLWEPSVFQYYPIFIIAHCWIILNHCPQHHSIVCVRSTAVMGQRIDTDLYTRLLLSPKVQVAITWTTDEQFPLHFATRNIRGQFANKEMQYIAPYKYTYGFRITVKFRECICILVHEVIIMQKIKSGLQVLF